MVLAFVIQGNACPDCSGQDTVYLECILRKVHGDNSSGRKFYVHV